MNLDWLNLYIYNKKKLYSFEKYYVNIYQKLYINFDYLFNNLNYRDIYIDLV